MMDVFIKRSVSQGATVLSQTQLQNEHVAKLHSSFRKASQDLHTVRFLILRGYHVWRLCR